jgi:hypothetical protein
MTRNSTASDNVRVLGWFADAGSQLDFMQFTNQTLTAAQINTLVGSSLTGGQSARYDDDPDRSLSRFVDSMNHFGGSRRARFAVVEDFRERASADGDWLSVSPLEDAAVNRRWGGQHSIR